jgi:2-oxoglutarate ferredoxin oxidoreductase subunit delta
MVEKQGVVEFTFDARLCKACGICTAFCPKSVFERDEEGKPVFAHKEKCIACGMCELRCPDYAIRIRRDA